MHLPVTYFAKYHRNGEFIKLWFCSKIKLSSSLSLSPLPPQKKASFPAVYDQLLGSLQYSLHTYTPHLAMQKANKIKRPWTPSRSSEWDERASIQSIHIVHIFFLHPRSIQQTLCVTNGPRSLCSILPQLSKYICSQAGAIKCSCEQPASPAANPSPAHSLFPLQPSCTSVPPACFLAWVGTHGWCWWGGMLCLLAWSQQSIPVFPYCHHQGTQKKGLLISACFTCNNLERFAHP